MHGDFAGEQDSVVGSKLEVVGGVSTGKKRCQKVRKDRKERR